MSPSISTNENDQHATVSTTIPSDKTTIHLRVSGDFGIAYPFAAPADGAPSSGLRIVSEQWNDAHNGLQLQAAGVNGKTYEVPIYNAPSGIRVKGAVITKPRTGMALRIDFPASGANTYSTHTVTLEFPAQ